MAESRDGKPYERVLDYLRDMIDYCRAEHRPDLVREYEDAKSIASAAIFGQLPRRPECPGMNQSPPGENILQPKPIPPWRARMLAKPMRRVLRRIDSSNEEAGAKLFLECGHLVWAGYELPGASAPKRRRCDLCASEAARKAEAAAAKPPQSAHDARKKKAESA